jgi:ABC-type uncharacterized transport system, ATPase component
LGLSEEKGLLVENVTKRYGSKTAVDGLSFRLDQPGVFGLLGTNGAGKTTTIRMILGILEKDSGGITWNGRKVARESVQFGYLPEERGLYPQVKVMDQLCYFASLRGISGEKARKAVNYWLGRLGAVKYADMPAERLSKGNQQKIQLVTAILHDPDLIVMDEPTSGLDPVNADLFKSVILELVEKGKYIVLSSHQMESVEEYCRDILLLVDGKTVLSGNLREIKRGYGRTNLFLGCEDDVMPHAAPLGITLVNRSAVGFELKIPSDESAYALLQKLLELRVPFDKFEIREPTLHEIFIEKAGDKQ